MQLASIPAIQPGVSPFETIQIASAHYRTAQQQLTFLPNAMQDPATMVRGATASAAKAVTILRPLETAGDMFTRRNATASISAANEGLALLQRALWAVGSQGSGPRPMHAPNPITLMEEARRKFHLADASLWME